jgi:hypothetical protein
MCPVPMIPIFIGRAGGAAFPDDVMTTMTRSKRIVRIDGLHV